MTRTTSVQSHNKIMFAVSKIFCTNCRCVRLSVFRNCYSPTPLCCYKLPLCSNDLYKKSTLQCKFVRKITCCVSESNSAYCAFILIPYILFMRNKIERGQSAAARTVLWRRIFVLLDLLSRKTQWYSKSLLAML